MEIFDRADYYQIIIFTIIIFTAFLFDFSNSA